MLRGCYRGEKDPPSGPGGESVDVGRREDSRTPASKCCPARALLPPMTTIEGLNILTTATCPGRTPSGPSTRSAIPAPSRSSGKTPAWTACTARPRRSPSFGRCCGSSRPHRSTRHFVTRTRPRHAVGRVPETSAWTRVVSRWMSSSSHSASDSWRPLSCGRRATASRSSPSGVAESKLERPSAGSGVR